MEKKSVALWTGGIVHTIIQFGISIKSYLLLPFIKEKPNAVKKYWSEIYSGQKNDNYIFDGKTSTYYKCLLNCIYEIANVKNRTVVDLGCGNGSLFYWLRQNGIQIGSYKGIDFSYPDCNLADDSKIMNGNITEYHAKEQDIITIVNCCCYLNDNEFDTMIRNISSATDILIIEPVPSIFWDKQFNNIVLHYRSRNDFLLLFKENGYSCSYSEVDYLYKLRDKYIFPLKYLVHFQKTR